MSNIKYFRTANWCGIVRNSMLIEGILTTLDWNEVVELLESYYKEGYVELSDHSVGLWQGEPDSWDNILAKPTTDNWWEGRLSLEESLIYPDIDGDYCQSGRQPRVAVDVTLQQ